MTTNLIEIAREDVITKAKEWASALADSDDGATSVEKAEGELLGAVILLNSREAMDATAHLDQESEQR